MPVTKRLRYEILRRDGHKCRYCGSTAPDVKLTVDHVVPVALGGPDEPSNLVAACEPCNSGKTSISADAPIVANVAGDAMRWAAAMERAAEIARADYEKRLQYRSVFRQVWDRWGTGEGDDRTQVPLEDGWAQSLDNFHEAGLPDWELGEAVTLAMSRQKVKPVDTFKYFCGICWTKIRKMQADARAIIGSSPGPADPDDTEQNRVAGAVAQAWKVKRGELGRTSTPEQDFNVDWQAGSWFARGVTESELTRAAEAIAPQGMSLASGFGVDMPLLSAVDQYYAASERLLNAAFNESSADRKTVWALVEMLQPTFEITSRAVDRLAEVAADGAQAAVLKEISLWMVFPRDRISDLFPEGYPLTWDSHHQVEWPAALWGRWDPETAAYPRSAPAWCGECDGPALHHRWRPVKVGWFGVDRTILEQCYACHPAMQLQGSDSAAVPSSDALA